MNFSDIGSISFCFGHGQLTFDMLNADALAHVNKKRLN